MNADDIHALLQAADEFDYVAIKRERHEGIAYEDGVRLLNLIEKHARTLAILLRREVVAMRKSTGDAP